MMDFGIHNVENVEKRNIKQLVLNSGRIFYCRDIIVKNDVAEIQIKLFSDIKENLRF